MHLAFILKLLSVAKDAAAAGKSVAELLKHGHDALEKMQKENRDPTPEEWAELDARIDRQRSELHAP